MPKKLTLVRTGSGSVRFVCRLLQHFATSAVVEESDVTVGGVVVSREGTNTTLELDAQLVFSHPYDVYAFHSFLSIS